MVALNENGKKVEAALSSAGLSLRDAGLSIRAMIDLGLVDATPPLTSKELRAVLAPPSAVNKRSVLPVTPTPHS